MSYSAYQYFDFPTVGLNIYKSTKASTRHEQEGIRDWEEDA
jgi:hypothetical protein